jgi:hypothetical protein
MSISSDLFLKFRPNGIREEQMRFQIASILQIATPMGSMPKLPNCVLPKLECSIRDKDQKSKVLMPLARAIRRIHQKGVGKAASRLIGKWFARQQSRTHSNRRHQEQCDNARYERTALPLLREELPSIEIPAELSRLRSAGVSTKVTQREPAAKAGRSAVYKWSHC